MSHAIRRLLLGLAFLAMPVAHAAEPRTEACDRPLPAGTEPTAAAIVRTACLEHKAWFQPFIDANGRLASLEVTEAERTRLRDDTPAWQRVARYWRESGTLSSMVHIAGARSCLYPGEGREADNDCRAYLVDNPWSAAFVSWVMARAPVPGFAGSPRHVDYITRAWRDPEGSPYAYADPFADRAAPGDLLCFLRDGSEALGPEGMRQALASKWQRTPQRSHCDIVVAADVDGDRTLYLVGGNVFDAVTMRMLPLDAEGRLLASEVGLPVRRVAAADEPAPRTTNRKGKAGKARKPARTKADRKARTPGTAKAVAVPAIAAATPGADAGTAADTGIPASAGTAGTGEEASVAPLPGNCRPADPGACSFNRRDWVVLLKLKPQAQLGGWLPAPIATD